MAHERVDADAEEVGQSHQVQRRRVNDQTLGQSDGGQGDHEPEREPPHEAGEDLQVLGLLDVAEGEGADDAHEHGQGDPVGVHPRQLLSLPAGIRVRHVHGSGVVVSRGTREETSETTVCVTSPSAVGTGRPVCASHVPEALGDRGAVDGQVPVQVDGDTQVEQGAT